MRYKNQISRPVKIEEDVYFLIKEYCDKNDLKISRWISKILKEKLNEEMDKKMFKSK
ncbi:MAG: hypothetical protein JETCAE03_32520 [Ignavibacteriaceae bacterium]|nr:MAG: hypothetical protein JETCAE03_32520 [Ignavibacteriaceae bacterium]